MNEYRNYLAANGGQPKQCRFCGTDLPPGRADVGYCADKSTCRSKAHQAGPRDYRREDDRSVLIHEAKDHLIPTFCQAPDCGNKFYVNEYADRGGKRQPMYCSRACKQRAYRERKKQNSSGSADKG